MSVKISEKKRKAVFDKTAGRCGYCGVDIADEYLTIDHIKPRALGGSNKLGNLVLACRPCNFQKRTKTVQEFRLWRAFNQLVPTEKFSFAQIEALIRYGCIDREELMESVIFYADPMLEVTQ